ncbi:hypothetical protein ALC57_13421, partial [Trachymyrmex cornetzi]
VDSQNFQSASSIWYTNVNLSIETSESAQCPVDAVRSIGSCHYNHMGALLHTIHQCQQLRYNTPFDFAMRLYCIPFMRKKNAPVSFATARAMRVFPVPGGPYNNIPRGGLTPMALNRDGCRRDITLNLPSKTIDSIIHWQHMNTFSVLDFWTCLYGNNVA